MKESRIIAIGDIHGCIHALDGLLDVIEPQADDRVVILGDFVDQGRDTRSVIDRLLDLRQQCQLVCLQGNHEEMMLAARESTAALRYWEECGGVYTLNSYHFGGNLDHIPTAHWDFLLDCVDSYESDTHLFVHANIDADLPLADQPGYALRWALLEPAEVRPHCSGKTVVMGHTEQVNGEVLDLGCLKCIDTACWKYGWLTALDVTNNQIWQASRFGQLREAKDGPVGPIAARA